MKSELIEFEASTLPVEVKLWKHKLTGGVHLETLDGLFVRLTIAGGGGRVGFVTNYIDIASYYRLKSATITFKE